LRYSFDAITGGAGVQNHVNDAENFLRFLREIG
jgi:hypothetical protein